MTLDPLDKPLAVSFFTDKTASTIRRGTHTLREMAEMVTTTTAPTKPELPWLKLATFGEHRSRGGSLRNNPNVQSISGVEVDYDHDTMTIDQAAAALTAANIAGLIYASPSHTETRSRWRVLCPCSTDLPPERRAELAGRLNHILGGKLSVETFTLSQAFFYGGVDGTPDRTTRMTAGDFLDLRPDIPALHPVRTAAAPLDLPKLPADAPPDAHATNALTGALSCFSELNSDLGRHQQLLRATNTVAPFVLSGHLDSDDVAEAIEDAMTESGREPNPGEVASAMAGALRGARPYVAPTSGAEFDALPAAPLDPVAPGPVFDCGIMAPGECNGLTSRPYLVKGLLAAKDVGCLFGPPGAGKSLLAPLLAYRVAQGRPFFGMRTRPGSTLYVAAEDQSGMQRRVTGLLQVHGAADAFGLVTRVSDLLNPSSGHLAGLLAEVQRRKPALIVIDTLAMAFPGLIENDADGMGKVVAVARELAIGGAAVLLVHHDTKARDGTPRGHSLLNGALDMAIQLDPKDGGGIIRGRLTKNRNGSCERELAFRIGVQVLGVDEDGDDVTAAIAVEASEDEAAVRPVKLSRGQTAAMDELRGLIAEAPIRAPDGSLAAREEVVIAAWTALSIAGSPQDRLRSARLTKQKLAAKGVLRGVGDGLLQPTPSGRSDQSDQSDRVGSTRINPTRNPDGSDHPLKGDPIRSDRDDLLELLG